MYLFLYVQPAFKDLNLKTGLIELKAERKTRVGKSSSMGFVDNNNLID